MAISSQGWAFVSGSGTGATDPGGLDTNIQFNNNGAFSGSSALITDGSGSLSASLNISASSFYGDGSNLTGLTASAVNVADGPEFSIQFRRDTPISGEISGSGALVFLTASSTLSLSSSLAISGTAAGFQSSEIYFGTKAQKVGQLLVEEDNGYLFVLKSSGGIDISGSDGVFAIIGEGTNLTVASAYTNTGLTLTNMSDVVAIDIGHDGAISGSSNLAAGGTFTVAGNSTFNGTVNLNAAATSSNVILSTTPAGTGPGMQLSASNPAFGPGQVYGQMFFGSGSIGGSGWTGTSIILSDFGGGEEFEFRAKNGATLVRADNGDATLRATAGEVILSGSAGIVGQTTVNLNAGLNTNNDSVSINAGMSVNNTALTINSSLQNNGISTFNDTATFNNSASVHNQGLTVNNANAVINSGLVANGDVTLGDASGDGVTWNAGSWNMSANAVVATLKDGVDGVSGNGALMFFTGSGGDFMKFHTSGSAKGIVFPQQTYLSKAAGLSGTLAGPGSFLAIDSDNKVVLATPSGGSPGGSNTQIQFNDAGTLGGDADFTWNKTTNALTIAGSTATSASSDQGLYFRAEGPDKTAGRLGDEPQLVVSGSMVGIGTATPSNSPSVDTFLDVRGHVRVGKSGTGYIFSNNDDNTFIKFGGSGVPGSDGISLFAGAKRMLVVDENASTPDAVIVGSASLETDFAVLTAMSAPNADSMSTAPALYVSGGADSVGVGTSSPLVSMDVHYTGSGNPVKLGNDTGGGHVAYFGTSSANLTAGGIYYLNKNGGWESANSATTGSGHNQLLGVALGAKAAGNGMLLKGYFDVSSFYSGSFIKGAPVYIQSSSVLAGRPVVGGGYLSSSAPTATDSYVRVVGYGTDTPNVVYFDPDSTYIEIGS